MKSSVKTANDLIADSIDAYFAGNENDADRYLDEAITQKVTERMVNVLKDLPEFSHNN